MVKGEVRDEVDRVSVVMMPKVLIAVLAAGFQSVESLIEEPYKHLAFGDLDGIVG